LDPNEPDRPIRNQEELKERYNALKRDVACAWDRFSRSGNQNGDTSTIIAGVDEWVLKFSSNNQSIMYSIFALDVQTINLLGRMLPRDAQRDSGLLGQIIIKAKNDSDTSDDDGDDNDANDNDSIYDSDFDEDLQSTDRKESMMMSNSSAKC
jgi:hypothetical protein